MCLFQQACAPGKLAPDRFNPQPCRATQLDMLGHTAGYGHSGPHSWISLILLLGLSHPVDHSGRRLAGRHPLGALRTANGGAWLSGRENGFGRRMKKKLLVVGQGSLKNCKSNHLVQESLSETFKAMDLLCSIVANGTVHLLYSLNVVENIYMCGNPSRTPYRLSDSWPREEVGARSRWKTGLISSC